MATELRLALVAALLLLFLDPTTPQRWRWWVFDVWIAVIVAAAARARLVMNIFSANVRDTDP